MFLIVGLGNPGKKYEATRHNLGFIVIDQLAARSEIKISKSKCNAFIGEGQIEGQKTVLAKPQTFMNLSGEAVRDLLRWYKLDEERLILIYDDVDLDVGELRLRRGGGSAGHKGVQSVMDCLPSGEFIRVRIGIGRESLESDTSDYVLKQIPKDQLDIIANATMNATDATVSILGEGLETAMNKFNGKKAE